MTVAIFFTKGVFMTKFEKVLRKIISCFIPSRNLRRAFRNGMFLYYLKLLRNYKKDEKLNFPYYLSVVLIVKNASRYIEEWINYHRIVGVEKFYIYDNESNDNLREVLKPYIKSGIVEYFYWAGKKQQDIVYNDALKRLRLTSKYVAFIDDDEFIVPMNGKTIRNVLEELDLKAPEAGLVVSWWSYGSRETENTTINDLVIERFKFHEKITKETKSAVKSIVNPRLAFRADYVHIFRYIKNFYSVDENKNICLKGLGNSNNVHKIRINHYHTKSLDEFLKKKSRGDAVYGEYYKENIVKHFDDCSKACNVIEDDSMEKYVEPIKRMIKEMRDEK